MILQPILEDKRLAIMELCKSLHVKRLYAFGSVVSERFTDSSDIDFLLSFADDLDTELYTENFFILYQKLGEMFSRDIDLVTERTLSNPYFIKSINDTKQLIYES